MGIPKSFNFLGCLEVTLILKDYKTVTGKIIKDDDRKYNVCAKDDGNCCCKAPNVQVDVDDKCDFILLELTRDAESVSLQEVEIERRFEIEWVNVKFKKGTCIAVNICDILYAGVNPKIDEEKFGIGVASALEANTEVPKT